MSKKVKAPDEIIAEDLLQEVLKRKYQATKIFVAVPVMDKKPFLNCHSSLMNALQVMLACNVAGFQFEYEGGLPYVSMARNNLARKFMESDCTDMIFIDADVGFPPGAFHDLIISEEEVVGGAYPKKQESEEFTVRLKMSKDGQAHIENGVLEAEGLGTGFLKIKRSVFEKLIAAYPELVYDDGMTGRETYNFFGEFLRNRRMFYDDYGFCDMWSRIGGRMWCLPNITFTHSGSKDFSGNLQEYVSKPRPEGLIKALKVEGMMSETELLWLYNRALEMDSIVELGSWKGKSTTVLLEGCKGPVMAVDNWLGHDPSSNGELERLAAKDDVYADFKENVGHYKNLTIYKGLSTEAVKIIPDMVDMVFIDADHTYEGCLADIDAWMGKCKKLMCGHDYNGAFPGVKRAVNERFKTVNFIGSIWYANPCSEENRK